MRQSKRDDILEAAKRVVQREGVTTLTYESVATEAGLTKGGLLYHFPSREALLLALHEYVAAQWEGCLEEEAGAPAEKLTAEQRFAAFVRLSQNPDRAEMLLMLEAGEDDVANEAWERVYARWSPGPPAGRSAPEGPASETSAPGGSGMSAASASGPGGAVPLGEDAEAQMQAFIARLAADGLWFYEALSSERLNPAVRERIVEEITRLGPSPGQMGPG